MCVEEVCRPQSWVGGSTALTGAAVRCEVTVTVAVACGAAVDAAVVVVGASVGPGVGQPGLSGRLPDVQQTRPAVSGIKNDS